jgi:polyisoprenoid-binding protein YceI
VIFPCEEKEHPEKLTILLAALVLALSWTLVDNRQTVAEPIVAEPIVALDTFEVDAVHSAMIFRIRYAGLSTFYGRFNEISGTFEIDEKNLDATKFVIKIKAVSDDSGNKQRDGHLSGPDFFGAKQFPEIRFVSKSVKAKANELRVIGELTLHGVTKTITAHVTYGGQKKGRRGGMRAGLDGKMTIKREDFGITFGKGHLGSDVTIEMGLTGLKSSGQPTRLCGRAGRPSSSRRPRSSSARSTPLRGSAASTARCSSPSSR